MSDIEIQGISYLKLLISSSGTMVPFITENDKTPSWDGSVFVYKEKTKNHKKKDLIGTVPVQVKSEETALLHEDKITHSFEVEDLRNYYNNYGIFLFVIEVGPSEKRIFYVALWCTDLKNILENLKRPEQKTCSLKLKELDPNKIDDLSLEFKNFLINREMQVSTKNYPLSIGQATELKIPIPIDPFQNPDYVFSHAFGLYGKINDTDIDRFIDKVHFGEFGKVIEQPVIISGKTYYSSYMVGRTVDGLCFTFGQEIRVDQKQLSFKLKGTLLDQLIDVNFMTDLLSTKVVHVGNGNISISNIGNQEEFLAVLNKNRKRLEDIKQIFELINISPDILKLDTLDDQSGANLAFLIDYFLYNRSKGSVNLVNGFNKIKIGNQYVGIFTIFSTIDNGFHVFNPYQPLSLIGFKFQKEDGNTYLINPYVFMDTDFLIHVDNLDLDMIIKDIKKNEISDEFLDLVNQFGLEIIRAFDVTKNDKYIVAGMEIFKWLLGMYSENLIYLLNFLQIIRRQRPLSKDEINTLRRKLIQETSNKIKTGIYIMLENKTDVRRCFRKLTSEEREQFLSFPIYTLAKELKVLN